MSILQAIVLGIVQGLTEFIPVSSSGHLVLLRDWMGISGNSLVFDVALHLGTLLALMVFFHKDILKLVQSIFKKNEYTNLAWIILAATIPAVIAGVLLQDSAESTLRSSTLVAATLIIGAIFMLMAEKYSARQKNKTQLTKVSLKQGLLVGLSQALALIPGVSRSGSTITVGLFSGINRKDATRFAFLLGIPIMVGAIIKIISDDNTASLVRSESSIFFAGIMAAFISGLIAIKFMLQFLGNHKLNAFAYYRIVLGLIVIFSIVL